MANYPPRPPPPPPPPFFPGMYEPIRHNDTIVSEALTDDNYESWSRAMENALRARKLFGFADGSITRPPDGTIPQYQVSWDSLNELVMSWLFASISQEMALSPFGLPHAETAAQIWKHYQDYYLEFGSPGKVAWKCPIASCGNFNSFISRRCDQCNYDLEYVRAPPAAQQYFSLTPERVGYSSYYPMNAAEQPRPYRFSQFTAGPSIPPRPPPRPPTPSGSPYYGQPNCNNHLSAGMHLSGGGTPFPFPGLMWKCEKCGYFNIHSSGDCMSSYCSSQR